MKFITATKSCRFFTDTDFNRFPNRLHKFPKHSCSETFIFILVYRAQKEKKN